MARYADIFLFVFLVNLGLSGMGSMPYYNYGTGLSAVANTFGAGVNFTSDANLQPNHILNTVGITVYSNNSVNVQPPATLTEPSFFTAGVFGWIYGGLVAIAAMVGAPYFVYQVVVSITNYAPLAALISGGMALIYYYFWILLLTGRYFTS